MNDGHENWTVKIFADGAILSSLERALGGSPFQDGAAVDADLLVVYAHETSPGAAARDDFTGLKRLQRALAHPGSIRPAKIAVLSFAPPSDLKVYSYLLAASESVRLTRCPNGLELADWQAPSAGEWRALTRRASEEELEIGCATFRHELQSLMAAARIYLGAAVVGHVGEADFQDTLAKLQGAANLTQAAAQFSARELLERWRRHRRFEADYRELKKPEGIRLWVLDDNWESHGWRTVLEAVSPPGAVRGFSNWDELKAKIEADAERPSVLMVDCNLGSGGNVPTGLELLRSIRSRWQDTRLVFATAYDDAALALTSLREGANGFFAKALNDAHDRRSKDYYLHFLDLLKPHPIEAEVSRLWRELTERTVADASQQTHGLPSPPDMFEKMLRLGFYLLFSLVDDNLWWRGRGWGLADSRHLYRAVVNLIRAGFPELRDYYRFMPRAVSGVLKSGAHGDPVEFNSLVKVIEWLLTELQFVSTAPGVKEWARRWPDYWPYRWPSQLQTDSTYPSLPPGTPLTAHGVADSLGALELLRGKYCNTGCRHGVGTHDELLTAHSLSPPAGGEYVDIVFIDDRGAGTGWFKAVKTIFPGCRTYDDPEEFFRDPGRVNLVLLDLRLPTHEKSAEVLRRLQELDASLPVLSISAGQDSLAAIRSLRGGALDFVSKTLPGPRDLGGCFQFADEFVSKCRLLREYGSGPLRINWQWLNDFRHSGQWMSGGAKQAAEAAVASCESEYRSLTAGMKSSALMTPPRPGDWCSDLAGEISILLRLQQQVFWLHNKIELPAKRKRLDFKRVYQIRPVDFWRWEYVLGSGKSSRIVKLVAILAGGVVDRLAQWNWCLENRKPLNPHLWGARDGVNITDEVEAVGGRFAWDKRNAALYATPSERWDANLCQRVIESVFTSVNTFFTAHGLLPTPRGRP